MYLTKSTAVPLTIALLFLASSSLGFVSYIDKAIHSPSVKSNAFAENEPSALNGAARPLAAQSHTILISNFELSDPQLTINQGDTVTWINQDGFAHQMKSDTGSEIGSAPFTTTPYVHTFNTAGNFGYHCQIHPTMMFGYHVTVNAVIVPPDLSLQMGSTGNFGVGQSPIYTLNVTNAGSGSTTGTITISDTLPNGITFISGAGTGWTCSASGQTVTCTNPNVLAATVNSTVNLTVNVGTAAVGTITNTATVSDPGDTNAADKQASKTVTVLPPPIISSLSPSAVTQGGSGGPLVVNGTNFVNGSTVQINGSSRQTTFGSATQLTATALTIDQSSVGQANIVVVNPDGSLSNTAILTINPPITITTAARLPNGVVGSAYNQTLTLSGGTAPFTWTVSSGSPPPNLSLSSSGVISGTPATAVDNTSFGVSVTDHLSGAASQTFTITITNPTISITTLQPNSATAGGAAFTLTVNGSGFLPVSTVQWNGSNRSTTFISSNQLTAAITAADIAIGGASSVTVVNPLGGGTSNSASFTINKASQTITFGALTDTTIGSSEPLSATASSKLAVTFSIASGSATLSTVSGVTSVTPTGVGTVVVQADQSGNDTFNAAPPAQQSFNATKANQTITFTALPATTSVNNSPFTVMATASSGLPVTFTVSGSLTVSASTVTGQGVSTASVTITGPGSGTVTANQGGNANFNAATPVSQTFTITSSVPVINSLSPSVVFTGGGDFTLTVNGNNFTASSVVQLNGSARQTAFISSGQLMTTVLSGDIAQPGTASIIVFTSGTGGGTSNSQALRIVAINSSTTAQAGAGGSATASTIGSNSSAPAVSATLNNSAGAGAATVTVATYTGNPTNRAVFDVSGGYTDLKVAGAVTGNSATANFYFPAGVTVDSLANLSIIYFNGSSWTTVRSSGNTLPLVNTTANLDGTTSGGRVTVTFDNTSRPKLSELTGTPFLITRLVFGDINNDGAIDSSDLVLLANFLAGNVNEDFPSSDVFLDGNVDATDLVTMANFLAGNIVNLPVIASGSSALNFEPPNERADWSVWPGRQIALWDKPNWKITRLRLVE